MNQDCVKVSLGNRSYDILFAGLETEKAVSAVRAVKGDKVLLVADSNTARYIDRASALFRKAGKDVFSFVFPAGEASKTMETAMSICSKAVQCGLNRNSLFAALGGGVAGDLTGFASSIFMRGTGYIQIPTTLLAMTDSSVGGKTAVDTPAGKNLAGSFHQPALVLMDMSLLQTLPERELRNGMAEVIKYGVIFDPVFFENLEETDASLLRDPEFLKYIIRRSCGIKAQVVASDEQETDPNGGRAFLNYGHTFGHAVEHLSSFSLSHGESVAVGMEMASFVSFRLGLCHEDFVKRQSALLKKFCHTGPEMIAGLAPAKILEVMKKDKKNRSGLIRSILPLDAGKVQVQELSPEGLQTHIEAFFAEKCGKIVCAENRIKVSVIGPGLLGTSLMMALPRKEYAVSGWCRNGKTAQWLKDQHVAEKMFASPEEAFRDADIVVLTMPAEATVSFMKKYAACCSAKTIVTDIASVKHEVMEAAAGLPELNFIGSHPMAGTEKSGHLAAFPGLYENADVFLVPGKRTSENDMQTLTRFWESLHTHVRTIEASEHDRLVANTSHSLHVIASALAMSILDEPDLQRRKYNFAGCATGFRDTSRIASSSPEMWRGICESNAKEILPALDRFEERLKIMKDTLKHGDFDLFEELFRKGRYLRDSWMCYKRASSLPAGIVLCGVKHAGKTTVSRQLSAILETESTDTDEVLSVLWTQKTGKTNTVREIYRELGEESFRRLEAESVRSLSDGKKRVISLGGGTVTNPFLSAEDIRKLGYVVYLDVSDETAFARILKNGLPPFLEKESDPFRAFAESNAKRRTAFNAIADFRIAPNPEKETAYDTASAILSHYKEAFL